MGDPNHLQTFRSYDRKLEGIFAIQSEIANTVASMLDDVKVELERQRDLVEQADAEHDFRAEFAAMRSTLGD